MVGSKTSYAILAILSWFMLFLLTGCSVTIRDQSYLESLESLLHDDANPYLPSHIARTMHQENKKHKKVFDTNLILVERRSPHLTYEELETLENMKWDLIELHTQNILQLEELRELFQENAIRKNGSKDKDKGIDLPDTIAKDEDLERILDENVTEFYDRNARYEAIYKQFYQTMDEYGASDGGILLRQLFF